MSDPTTKLHSANSPSGRPPPRIPDHELIRQVGRGSYGEVWLARSVTGAFRAAKIVYRDRFDNDRPFEREFTGIQRFEPISRTHDSQVDILHVGRTEGSFYYLMELADDAIAGQDINPSTYTPRTLRSELSKRGRLPYSECIEVALGLATALDHLHRHGLVHRDIKPGNIIFVNGVPKLADIGLVASLDATRSYVGTEGYLPPEGPGTPQADIYSLGKVLYEMCTGLDRLDFPDLPTQLVALPDRESFLEINAIMVKACAADPADRYQSARELGGDLAVLQAGKSVRRVQFLERRLRRFTRVMAGALAIGALLGGAFLLQRQQTTEARRLARENARLTRESRNQLMRMQVAHGHRLIKEGKSHDSMMWFTEALKLAKGDPAREEIHRIRLNFVLNQHPKVVQMFQHADRVYDCAFSPDGQRLVSASKDGTAQVWDLATGKPAAAAMRHPDAVRSATFSPDGQRILTVCSDNAARVWDVASGRQIYPPLKHAESLRSASFSPNGQKLVTGSADGTAQLWDAASGQALSVPLQHGDKVVHCSFSPDGHQVLTACLDGMARLWDAESGELIVKIQTGAPVQAASFSPDGQMILTGSGDLEGERGNHARIWNAATGQPIVPPIAHAAPVRFASFSSDGRRILTTVYEADRGAVGRIWDSATGEKLGPSLLQGSQPWASRFSPDGSRITLCSENGTARVWDAQGALLTPPLKHAGWVHSAVFSPHGNLLATASDDQLVRIWNLGSIAGPSRTFVHDAPVTDARLTANNERVITGTMGGNEGVARVWDAAREQKPVAQITFSNELVGAIFSLDGATIVSAGHRFVARESPPSNAFAWDAATGRELFRLTHNKAIHHVAFSHDGRRIVTASLDCTAKIWNAADGLAIGSPLQHKASVDHASFSPDGRHVVTGSEDGSVQVWDAGRGREAFPAMRHQGPVHHASFSPNGKRIASTSQDQTIRVWDAADGHPITAPLKHGGRVVGAAFSPDSRAVASWSYADRVNVWNVETGERTLPPLYHDNDTRIWWAEFSRDGRFIVTAGKDGTARLWDASTGDAVSPPLPHGGIVFKASFDSGSTGILTACQDGRARLWEIGTLDWTIEEIESQSALLGAYEIDRTLSHSRLSPERIYSAFLKLRAHRPEHFNPCHWLQSCNQ